MMCLLDNTPIFLKCAYKLLGIVQFSYDTKRKSAIYNRIFCLPFYFCLLYLCMRFNLNTFRQETVFHFIDIITNSLNIVYIFAHFIFFYIRSDSVRNHLTKVVQIQISPNPIVSRRPQWKRNILLGLFIMNFSFIPFIRVDLGTVLYLYYSFDFISTFEFLFLDDLLDVVLHKLQLINQHFLRQSDSVDFLQIFPLSKTDKIKFLQEEEIIFRIEQMQAFSDFHYDLVNLSQELVKNFDVTLIVSLIVWFETAIETAYYVAYVSLHGSDYYIFVYGVNFIFLVLQLYKFFFLIWIFSKVEQESNKTATFVHEVWNKYAMSEKIDNRVRYLEVVSVKLLNTKLQFTVMGFFNLNREFCHMVRVLKV